LSRYMELVRARARVCVRVRVPHPFSFWTFLSLMGKQLPRFETTKHCGTGCSVDSYFPWEVVFLKRSYHWGLDANLDQVIMGVKELHFAKMQTNYRVSLVPYIESKELKNFPRKS
jgi:hypothetical protein